MIRLVLHVRHRARHVADGGVSFRLGLQRGTIFGFDPLRGVDIRREEAAKVSPQCCQRGAPLCQVRRQGEVCEATVSGGRAEQRVKDTFRHPTAAEVCADVGTKIAIANLRLELERQRQATTSKFPRVCETHGDQDGRSTAVIYSNAKGRWQPER